VLVKYFGVELIPGDSDSERPIEVRFMLRRSGQWEFYTYYFEDGGPEARLITEPVDLQLDVEGLDALLDYRVPAEASCKTCHAFADGRALGPRSIQLNYEHDYGGVATAQLDLWRELGLVEGISDADSVPELVNFADEDAELEERVLAYFQGNCVHCHDPEIWLEPDLNVDNAVDEICGQAIEFASPWVDGELRVDPGHPERSNLWLRMNERGYGQMPALGTAIVDPLGLALVGEWIESLDDCP
jgi:hypothetical protein